MRFIYVMNYQDRDKLLAMGYDMLKSSKDGKVSVFIGGEELAFSDENPLDRAGITYVLSDVLTF